MIVTTCSSSLTQRLAICLVFPLPKTLIDESEGSSSLVLSDFELVEGGSGRRGGGGGGCGVESAALVVGLIAG